MAWGRLRALLLTHEGRRSHGRQPFLFWRTGLVGVRDAQSRTDGLPVIDAAESEEITVAVSADDLQAGDMKTRTSPGSDCVAASDRRG